MADEQSNEIAKAKKVLADEQAKKQKDFLDEYKTLCVKHGMELVVVPQMRIASLNRPIRSANGD